MKKLGLLAILVIILSSILVLASCGGNPATTKATTPAATGEITKGGTLRIIAAAIPKDLGYPPEKAPSDSFQMLPVLEHLCDWGPNNGELVPGLATSWETDQTAKTITWHLRQGVKFSDGEPFNAEAVRWNVQLAKDTMSISSIQFVESLEVKDDYTLVMHMTQFDWQTTQNLGLTQCISPKSYLTAGGTIASGSDNDKSIEWARANAVGTGPFTVSEWVRDDHITFVKNPNYWDAGKPYLDKIIMTAIADPMVASAKLQAGEADMWADTSSMNDILALKAKDFKLVQGPGMFFVILYSDVDPASPLSNIKVREAIEYAIDRPTIAQTLGQGYFEPFTQMASKTWPGYVPGYDPRPYSVDKAKQLLSDAGYPQGFTIKILGASGGNTNDVMAQLKYDLSLVNINLEPDIADLGRYYGALFGREKGGWDGLCLTASGINPDASDIFVHYGPNPMTFATPNILKTQAYIDYCNQAIDPSVTTSAAAIPFLQKAIKQAGEDALFLPLWRTYEASVVWPYVHTEYPKIHGIVWQPQNDWMEAH